MSIVDPKNTHTYLVTTAALGRRLAEGIGCNFLVSNQADLPRLDEADPDPALTPGGAWRQVAEALEHLGAGWLRVGVIPTAEGGAWDDDQQVWDFDHPHFDWVRRVGRWAGDRGLHLMFDPFVVPPSFVRGGAAFADDPRDYARKLILPVARLFREEGLTSYRYLGLLNEKVWGPGKEGFAAVPAFHELYRAVREVLDEDGIPAERLGLLGPSNLSAWEWPIADFFAAGLDPDPLWVGYDQHLYLFHFDWMRENTSDFMPLTEMTEHYLRRYADYAHKRGKPLFITELGNMYCGRLFWGERDFEGPATHTSVLMDAELIVRGLAEGVDGFLRWAFCVRSDCDGRWSLLENQAGVLTPSPHAHPMYRLLMSAVRPRATLIESSVRAAEGAFRYVFSAAVQNPDGSASLLLINDMPGKNLNVGLALGEPFRGRTLVRTVCDELRKGDVLSSITISAEGEGGLMLTPASLTVLSTGSILS